MKKIKIKQIYNNKNSIIQKVIAMYRNNKI